MTDTEREKLLAAARDALLAAIPDAMAIYVYGSFARAEEWPDSDLDLGVLLAPDEPVPDLLGLMGKISAATGRDIDLVNLRQIGDVLSSEILADGRTLYVADAEALLAWEASAMSRYAQYREATRGIFEDFSDTGIGYAK